MAEATGRGALAPALVVVPQGDNGYWSDWLDGQHAWGALVPEVLVPALRGAYPVEERPGAHAIAGLSMGGFGALSVGLRHPELFGVVAALSPTDLELAVKAQPGRKTYTRLVGRPADQRRLAAINPLHLVQAGKGAGQRFLLAWGAAEADKFAVGCRRLESALRGRGVPVEVRPVPGGGHGFGTTWSPETMAWWLDRVGAR